MEDTAIKDTSVSQKLETDIECDFKTQGNINNTADFTDFTNVNKTFYNREKSGCKVSGRKKAVLTDHRDVLNSEANKSARSFSLLEQRRTFIIRARSNTIDTYPNNIHIDKSTNRDDDQSRPVSRKKAVFTDHRDVLNSEAKKSARSASLLEQRRTFIIRARSNTIDSYPNNIHIDKSTNRDDDQSRPVGRKKAVFTNHREFLNNETKKSARSFSLQEQRRTFIIRARSNTIDTYSKNIYIYKSTNRDDDQSRSVSDRLASIANDDNYDDDNDDYKNSGGTTVNKDHCLIEPNHNLSRFPDEKENVDTDKGTFNTFPPSEIAKGDDIAVGALDTTESTTKGKGI